MSPYGGPHGLRPPAPVNAAAKRPVADPVAVLEEAREEWAAAAGAEDADTFHDHQPKGSALTGWDNEVTARKALGPTSSRPACAPAGGQDPRAAGSRCDGAGNGEKVPGYRHARPRSSHRVILWPLLARQNPGLPRCCCLYNLMGAARDFR